MAKHLTLTAAHMQGIDIKWEQSNNGIFQLTSECLIYEWETVSVAA